MPGNVQNEAVRILVIGCGSIGKRHLTNLLEAGVKAAGACDVRADRCREVKERFGIEAVQDLERAFACAPQVAFITTPTSLHVPLALLAAEHGCHLFIEKPLSDQMNPDVDRLLAVVRERQLMTMVACNLRFHPGLIAVKRLLQEGAIGRVVAARVEAGQYLPDWHPWEDYREGYSARRALGGGVILDAIHEIDYIRWLLGEVESVACFAGKLSHLAIETEDTAAILLRFVGGTIGQIHVDYLQRAYSRTCQLIGEEGTIRWDYDAGEVRWYSAGTNAWDVIANPPGWQANQMYADEIQHVLRCLAGSEQPAVNIEEGTRVLGLALAAKASSQEGKIIWLSVPQDQAVSQCAVVEPGSSAG